jgi:hypothetical protein
MDEKEIVQKLVRRFGWGSDREKRSALYHKIARAVVTGGEDAYRVVATVAAESDGKQHPDRYFCFAAVRRLGERGFLAVADL